MLVYACIRYLFFFNDTATTEIYTLSLHDALPIYQHTRGGLRDWGHGRDDDPPDAPRRGPQPGGGALRARSEEHTSELQSRQYLVCRLLLEKKKEKRLSTDRLRGNSTIRVMPQQT